MTSFEKHLSELVIKKELTPAEAQLAEATAAVIRAASHSIDMSVAHGRRKWTDTDRELKVAVERLAMLVKVAT